MAGKTRRCAVCKQEIDAERAQAIPQTRLCQEHAIAIKRYGGEFRISTVKESTRKERSLKPGAETVVRLDRHRNEEAIARLRDEYEAQRDAEGHE